MTFIPLFILPLILCDIPLLHDFSVSLYPCRLFTFIDFSDASRACLVSEFRCESSHRCVPLSWVCDGVKDCPDNEDEGGPKCNGIQI